jgi:2-polyprenyl-3-methyl-5-hydroxy-6-metoxy-1,4-benzoquinol methylase
MKKGTIQTEEVEKLQICPLCESNNFINIAKVFVKNVNYLDTVICKECHFVFRQKRPSLEWFKKLWSDNGNSNNNILFIPTFRDKFRYKRYSNLEKILKKMVKNLQVLDLGTNTGFGLKAFHDKGWKVQGVEPDSIASKQGNQLGLKIFNESIEEFLKNNKQQYELVLLIHTLEHFHNPKKSLQEISKKIKKNGFLYVEVPNIEESVNYRDVLDYHHMNIFSKDVLTNLLLKVGLKPKFHIKTKSQPFGPYHLGIIAEKISDEQVIIKKDKSFIPNDEIKRIYIQGLPGDHNFIKFPIKYNNSSIFDIDLVSMIPYKNNDGTWKIVHGNKLELFNRLMKRNPIKITLNLLSRKMSFIKDPNFEKFGIKTMN